MIKKLRRRFIFIMMSMVAVVMIITFSVLIFSSAKRLEEDSVRNLEEGYGHMTSSVLDKNNDIPGIPDDIGKKPFEKHMPYSAFYATLDGAGTIIHINDMSNSITNETAQEAVSLALKQNTDQGVVSSLSLRYLIFETSLETQVIGFININFEQEFVRQQIVSYSLIGLGSLSAFFVISLILSSIAIRPVDKAWKKQQQFIADASHELKTPLTIMLANTSILLSEKNTDKTQSRKWVTHIDQEAKHMQKLVEDLLFLARVDAKDNEIPLTRIDLGDTVCQSVLPFEPVMFEAGLKFVVDIASGLYINGNSSQIKQLISILLDNAQKYAYPDSAITFRLYPENNRAVLSVSNFANPIDKVDLPHIFNRFYKADKARTRGSNSYGLGLAIAKEIVGMHGGKITVSSNETDGTTFSVMLPLIG